MKKTKLRIHTWPEKILRTRCKKVEAVDDNIRDIFREMLCLMRIHGGIGLAANQAGLDLDLLVIDFEDKVYRLVNPRIIKREGSITFREGCLSFPGLELNIKRDSKVWVKALNEKGDKVEIAAEGLLSIVLQHEIDHLGGIMFIDRISFWQKIKAYGKLKAIARRTGDGMRKHKEES
jgi:peptide deformylase